MRPVAWIAGYPRAGLGRLASMLAAYQLDDRAPTLSAEQDAVPDLVRAYGDGHMLRRTGDRTVLARTEFLPGLEVLRPYETVTGKVVYLARDPRDLILSALRARRMGGPRAQEFAKAFITTRGVPGERALTRGTWTTHVAEWTSPEQVRRHFPHAETLVQRYEDLSRDPAGALAKVAAFLELDGADDSDRARRAVHNSSLDWVHELGMRARGNAYQAPPPPPPPGPDTARTLAELGDEVEEAYRRLLDEDDGFRRWAEELGYAG